MKNITAQNMILSTAAFCLWNISAEEKIEYCRDLKFTNIQVALSTMKMLDHFVANVGNLPRLRKFRNVTIHGPWCGIKYGDNRKTKEILEKLRYITQCASIKGVVFNFDSIGEIDVLCQSRLEIMIRNPVKAHLWHDFIYAIKQYGLSWVFDLNKGTRNDYDIEDALEELHEFVGGIHVSGFMKGKNRMPITTTKQESLLKHLDRFDIENMPIIIEGLFSPNDFQGILSEKELIMRTIKQKHSLCKEDIVDLH